VAGRVIATFSVVLLIAVALGSCTSSEELTPPQLPCTNGGRLGDDGVVVFDVPLRQLLLGQASILPCEGRTVRTTGYLCYSEFYGPILFESREVAEADGWRFISLSWWPTPPPRLSEPFLARGLQVFSDATDKFNGSECFGALYGPISEILQVSGPTTAVWCTASSVGRLRTSNSPLLTMPSCPRSGYHSAPATSRRSTRRLRRHPR
jgi:hypothetical protein